VGFANPLSAGWRRLPRHRIGRESTPGWRNNATEPPVSAPVERSVPVQSVFGTPRMHMDGRGKYTVVEVNHQDIIDPSGLTVDSGQNHEFWRDRSQKATV